ncbi:hypothetical protein SAMN04490203_3576 [Pseudomonas taetrolens]|uniref:Lipoprotein n=1 Tax=Pseudomonas taetrolens TaxID=47884 RepID=A0A1H4X3I3_PSETA|nr:hypothetical protein [Pseudomonas taetrolens]SED00143.1 hypothetical protein SAMN04490203_3576 [Pseudomonas taetrolens]SQF87617.1 lipoprotein [Pseudomonas taetrolens]VEH50809.1 lipoprotein [Pseudomonas taetrolens]
MYRRLLSIVLIGLALSACVPYYSGHGGYRSEVYSSPAPYPYGGYRSYPVYQRGYYTPSPRYYQASPRYRPAPYYRSGYRQGYDRGHRYERRHEPRHERRHERSDNRGDRRGHWQGRNRQGR